MLHEMNFFSMDIKSQNYGYRTVGLLALSSIIMHILDYPDRSNQYFGTEPKNECTWFVLKQLLMHSSFLGSG